MSFKGETDKLQHWYRDGVRWLTWPTCGVTSKVKGQDYNVTSAVWRVSAHNSIKKKSQKHQNWQECCPCCGWYSATVARWSKVKVTNCRPLWVAVQVIACRAGRGHCGRTTGHIACYCVTCALVFKGQDYNATSMPQVLRDTLDCSICAVM